MSEFKPYLASAHIEGYKSIVNCDVTFKPGLNIIIGKNGTGKTNLLEGIWLGIIARSYGNYLKTLESFRSKLDFSDKSGSLKRIQLQVETQDVIGHGWRPFTQDLISEDGVRYLDNPDERSLLLFVHLFRHGIPLEIPLFNSKGVGWSVQAGSGVVKTFGDDDPKPWHTIGAILQEVKDTISKVASQPKLNPDELIDLVSKSLFKSMERLLPLITSTTPIRDVIVRKGNVDNTPLEGKLEASGFQYLFRIGNQYLPFDHLSDGTKRILLMVLELLANGNFGGIYGRLFLLEEPELGIHPHQLHLLMDFLKEQSKEKQIILTTHSPEVLDILDEEELDRIIITSFDAEKGSQFRHLSKEEVEKARRYMEEGLQLSDYWRFSDLEPHQI